MDKNNYQIIFNNPDGTVDLGIKELKIEPFLKKIISQDDVDVLKNTNSKTINNIIDKLDEDKSIKMLMKQIFKK